MKKRKMTALLLAAILLFGGCSANNTPEETTIPVLETLPTESPTEPPTEPQIIEELPVETVEMQLPDLDPIPLPRIDGSTACIPLMLQVVQDTCGLEADEAQFHVSSSKTAASWLNLMSGDTDLVLAYEMPESVREQYTDGTLQITAIGRDALVFLANAENPVQSLTQQQLIDIYAGKITDWSKVGGEDKAIIAYQRDPSSGSHTLFQKLLMRDNPLMEAPKDYYIAEMGFLVEAVAGYHNDGSALGYSVYYYISQMKNDPDIKLLGVDGVTPSDDTIAEGSYPLTNEFYVAIRSDEPEDSPARLLYNWICSDAGRQCLVDAGYVPAS